MFSMVAMVQTKFVGSMGAPAVAAVGAGQRVFFALQALLMAIGVGTTALVARSWGAGQRRRPAASPPRRSCSAAWSDLVLMIFGMLFSHQIAEVFGLDEHAAQLASRNIFWLSAFIIGFAIDIILSSALRAAGNAWTPLLFGLAVNHRQSASAVCLHFGKLGRAAHGCRWRAVCIRTVVRAVRCGARVAVDASEIDASNSFPATYSKRRAISGLLHIGYPGRA